MLMVCEAVMVMLSLLLMVRLMMLARLKCLGGPHWHAKSLGPLTTIHEYIVVLTVHGTRWGIALDSGTEMTITDRSLISA